MTTRLQQLHHWLSATINSEDYRLQALSGDASSRRYFRLTSTEQTFVVMDAPIEQEECTVFVDICKYLSSAQINVPKIIAQDLQQGFLLLSDLGDQQYLDALLQVSTDQQAVGKLYDDAVQVLVQLQRQTNRKDLPLYDEALLVQEMTLFRDWLLQRYIGLNLTVATHSMLDSVFKLLVDEALAQPRVFVHRDFHSRNLMVSESGSLGVLDFQDAVYGPFTYDLVSLLKDCYIKWPKQQVQAWALNYFAQFANIDTDIDATRFIRWFDLMGVQRHLKASGIFARLYLRDGKQGYLADIPTTLSYIIELHGDYPELQGLIELIEDQVMVAMPEIAS